MQILTANTGSYPRVGEKETQLRLRKAYQNWEKGEISDEKLEEIYEDYTLEVIEEQEKAGLDIVTDGQLRWYDPLSHFAKNIGGCKIDGLLRYFDTDFYVRQPVVIEDIYWKRSTVKKEFQYAKSVSNKILKPVLTGPYTLAKYTIDRNYSNLRDLTLDFAKIIEQEVKELVNSGAKEIQIDEPAILKNTEEYEIFSSALNNIAKSKKDSQLDLYLYFGDSAEIYEKLQDLSVDLLGLDFTYSPRLVEKITEFGSEKLLGLGLVDARNTKMEDPKKIVSVIEKILSSVNIGKIYLNPSSGIEYLPRKRAFEKLRNMVKIAEEVRDR